jgi:hypothetical protein
MPVTNTNQLVRGLKAKFLMLVVSQRHASKLQKEVSFMTEEKSLYLLQLSNFLELRYVSLRCDKHQKFHLLIVGHGLLATTV